MKCFGLVDRQRRRFRCASMMGENFVMSCELECLGVFRADFYSTKAEVEGNAKEGTRTCPWVELASGFVDEFDVRTKTMCVRQIGRMPI
jgi:hypothetical protein